MYYKYCIFHVLIYNPLPYGTCLYLLVITLVCHVIKDLNSQMPLDLISGAYEWINEIPPGAFVR